MPLFFGEMLFHPTLLSKTLYAFIVFCLGTSVVYIINDIKDVDKDRNHPTKCHRPIASKAISIPTANFLVVIISSLTILLSVLAVAADIYSFYAPLWLLSYLVLNFLYSSRLKHIPIVDVVILAAGFLIRLYYGSCVTGIEVSSWLYLTVLGGAFYLGMGKRRNELQHQISGQTREVLKKYNYAFLDKNMHIFVAFTEICYALWAVQNSHTLLMWTVPIVMVIFMKYSLHIESMDCDGNPMDVVLSDKNMLALVFLYIVFLFVCIYIIP
ncbi:MAG: UbiA prenyltransferase family protein [Lachnospiraceae bacterium]